MDGVEAELKRQTAALSALATVAVAMSESVRAVVRQQAAQTAALERMSAQVQEGAPA